LTDHDSAARLDPADVDRTATLDVPVLITCGDRSEREHYAHMLHHCGRRKGAFIAFRCDTDASEPLGDRGGLQVALALARRGTLFLDEVAAMRPELQCELLLLTDVGNDSGTRIVSGATHWPAAQIARGLCDATLFYRLNIIHLQCHAAE
jgi:DNA-binding NtrC family response regulator